jgi:hypothetical protein
MTIEAMLTNQRQKKLYLGAYIKNVYIGVKMPLSANDNFFRLGQRLVAGPQTHQYVPGEDRNGLVTSQCGTLTDVV